MSRVCLRGWRGAAERELGVTASEGGADEGTLGCKFIDHVAVPSTSDGKARARYAVALIHEFINTMVSPCCRPCRNHAYEIIQFCKHDVAVVS